MITQSTNHIMMMEPVGFHSNPETFESNTYQKPDDLAPAEINHRALLEFRALRDALVEKGVVVTTALGDARSPDAIFCNNAVATFYGQKMCLYPMMAPNRRIERRGDFIGLLKKTYTLALDLSGAEERGHFLESTGAHALDRVNKIAYCALSPRCDEGLAQEWCTKMGYTPVLFHTRNHAGKPVYHTDVVMFIGSGYIGICLACVVPEDRARVAEIIRRTHTLIDLSMDQLRAFCGNALEVVGKDGQKFLALSASAHTALTPEQKTQILKHVSGFISADISTIETYGGGSARCMLLELF